MLHDWWFFSRNGPTAFYTDSTMNVFAQQPIVLVDTGDVVSYHRFHLLAGEHVECSTVCELTVPQVFPRIPYQHKGVDHYLQDVRQQSYQLSAPAVSHRVCGLRSRLTTAGFHARRQEGFALSHFFPRSVGFAPTDSWASGAFTIAPSMLCHDHAMPSMSSYSTKPKRHIDKNTPRHFHSRKYLWTELALPYSLGNAFHWQPVRRTYTIPSNTFLGSIGLRPPPGLRLYWRPVSRLLAGISGFTFSHNSSDTVHDFFALMDYNITLLKLIYKNYLRISS